MFVNQLISYIWSDTTVLSYPTYIKLEVVSAISTQKDPITCIYKSMTFFCAPLISIFMLSITPKLQPFETSHFLTLKYNGRVWQFWLYLIIYFIKMVFLKVALKTITLTLSKYLHKVRPFLDNIRHQSWKVGYGPLDDRCTWIITTAGNQKTNPYLKRNSNNHCPGLYPIPNS